MTHAHDANVLLLLALEFQPGAQPTQAALTQAEAATLAEHIARDLSVFEPRVEHMDLVLAGAHFDPAEALRPGWPLHRRLHELRLRAPRSRGEARLIAFGRDAEGDIPQPLQDEAALRGGSLRVVPLLLSGDDEAIAEAVSDTLENELMERGMAGAATALHAQQAFGVAIEHARLLTIHDLLAMTALQYEHMGLQPIWPVIEAALLRPETSVLLEDPPEPILHYRDGEVLMALESPADWRVRCELDTADEAKLERYFARFQMRKRQIAAVLDAHAIPVLFDGNSDA